MILVPGFGAFDALGSVLYYSKVLEVLREDKRLCVHFFPNLPMASVASRAEALEVWIGKRVERGTIQDDDAIHLVGHSTGGLDIRQLLARLRDSDSKGILDHVKSIQCISTPHRGTNLARWAGWLGLGARCGVGLLLRGMQFLGSRGTGCLGHALRCHVQRDRAPDWLDAILDAWRGMSQCQGSSGYEAAKAREAYHTSLQWLENMARDTAAISDLRPVSECGCVRHSPLTPARWSEDDLAKESALLKDLKIDHRVRSIATMAWPVASSCCGGCLDLFRKLHWVICQRPQSSLYPHAETVDLDRLLGGKPVTVDREANDGIVNSISMIWPDHQRTWIVEADHGDIIGHYPQVQKVGAYDLLVSQPAFTQQQFKDVWRSVRRHAV
jgi:pimeloyl-ACP methyl ester carboxylesterase